MINKDRLRAAVQAANLPCLLMSVYQLTGDEKWLADPFRPRRPRGIDDDDTGGLSDETQAVLRSAAFDAVVGYTEGAPAVIPAPRGELLRAMMSTCVGEEVPSAFEEMVAAEMRFAASPITLDDDDAPDAQRPRVAVVGAGVGGLTVALTLKNAGPVHRLRTQRRRRRCLVHQQLPRRRRRHPQLSVLMGVLSTLLVEPLRQARRGSRLHPGYGRRIWTAGVHRVRYRCRELHLGRNPTALDASAAKRSHRTDSDG